MCLYKSISHGNISKSVYFEEGRSGGEEKRRVLVRHISPRWSRVPRSGGPLQRVGGTLQYFVIIFLSFSRCFLCLTSFFFHICAQVKRVGLSKATRVYIFAHTANVILPLLYIFFFFKLHL